MRNLTNAIVGLTSLCFAAAISAGCLRQDHHPETATRVLIERSIRKIAWATDRTPWFPPGTYHYTTRVYLPSTGHASTLVISDTEGVLRTDRRGNGSWSCFIGHGHGWSDDRGIVCKLDPGQCAERAAQLAPVELRDLVWAYVHAPEALGWRRLSDGTVVEAVKIRPGDARPVIFDFDLATGLPATEEFDSHDSPGGYDTVIRFVTWKKVPTGLLPGRTECYHQGVLTRVVTLQSYTPTVDRSQFQEPHTWTPRKATSLKFDFESQLPLVTIRMNGAPLRLVVDTGSSVTTLSVPAAQRLRLPLGESVNDTFSFRQSQSRYSQVRTIEVGSIRFDDFPISVTDAPPGDTEFGTTIDGLLGNDILAHFQLTVDYPRRLLMLQPRFAIPPMGSREHLRLDDGRAVVEAQVLGTSFPIIIDTGSDFTTLTPVTIKRLSARCTLTQGTRRDLKVLPALRVAGRRVTNYEVWAPSQEQTEGASVEDTLGNTFLKSFRVTIDYARQILILQPEDISGPNSTIRSAGSPGRRAPVPVDQYGPASRLADK